MRPPGSTILRLNINADVRLGTEMTTLPTPVDAMRRHESAHCRDGLGLSTRRCSLNRGAGTLPLLGKAALIGVVFLDLPHCGLNRSLAAPSSLYELTTIAETGQPAGAHGSTFRSFKPTVSVDDRGRVAFVAVLENNGVEAGQAVFVGDAVSGSVQSLSSLDDLAKNRTFGSVSLNDQGKVATTALLSGNPKRDDVRVYPGTSGLPFDIICSGGGARDPSGAPVYPFDNIFQYVTINRSGTVAFSGQVPFTTFTALTTRPGTEQLTLSGFVDLRPALSDSGWLALRSGAQADSPVLLWAPGFEYPIAVATKAGGFSRIGKSPGISRDGSIVVFCGNRGNGTGIFASIQTQSDPRAPRPLIRIAGENDAAAGPSSELGTTSVGTPLYFADFDVDSPIGIAHFPGGSTGASGDSITVCFLATPSAASASQDGIQFSAAQGLWVIRVNLDQNAALALSTVQPVLQAGDVLISSMGPRSITNIHISDSLDRLAFDKYGNAVEISECEHRVAFLAVTSSGESLVLAERVCRDLTIHRLNALAVDQTPPGSIDEPIRPIPDPAVLASQPAVTNGLIADGVTPILFKFAPQRIPTGVEKFTITFSVPVGGGILLPSLSERLLVFDGSRFLPNSEIEISPARPIAFAYLPALRPEELNLDITADEIKTVLELKNTGGVRYSTPIAIRKTPVALIHGYKTDRDTWGPLFLGTLFAHRPDDFVIPVQYGVDPDGSTKKNTSWSFRQLAHVLDEELIRQVEVPLAKDWAFTRYDVVGHSQGGVLLRLLSSQSGFDHVPAFANESNSFRGRFRRIMTIDSPHNGSVIPYYTRGLFYSLHFPIPGFMDVFGYLQDKFDPFGEQIEWLESVTVNPYSRWHLIRTGIVSGSAPGPSSCPLSYKLIGLCTADRGPVLLPRGSDGVVDFDSIGGGPGNALTDILSPDIAHSGPEWLFGVAPDSTATANPDVATSVIEHLDNPSSLFGEFRAPDLLSAEPERQKQINRLIASVVVSDLIAVASPSTLFRLNPLPSEPPVGPVSWFAEVFGPSGLSTQGVHLRTSGPFATDVEFLVEESLLGDVILYCTYVSSNGKLVAAEPLKAFSRSVGGNLISIRVEPLSLVLSKGDCAELELWGQYDNGDYCRLYLDPESDSLRSADSSVVAIEANRVVCLVGVGTTIVSATYQGLQAQATVSTLSEPRTRLPPLANPDSVATTEGTSVNIPVLANDTGGSGALDASSITVVAVPQQGSTALVPGTQGVVTYTPKLSWSGVDTFTYTVLNDLGAASNEAVVTVAVSSSQQPSVRFQPIYFVQQMTFGGTDHRYPRINNHGEFVYNEMMSGLWQVKHSRLGQRTFPDATYSDGKFPSIADDGSFVCYRNRPGDPCRNADIAKYVGSMASVIDQSSSQCTQTGDFRYMEEHPSVASDGRITYSVRTERVRFQNS